MYAVIRTGGKQYKVAPGDRLPVEKLGAPEATLTPLLVVDGDRVTTDADALAGMPVVVRAVGEGRGKKIKAGKYKNKTRYRRRWGHRQDFTMIEVARIGDVEAAAPAVEAEEAEPSASEEAEAPDDEAEAAASAPVEEPEEEEQVV